MSSALSEVGPDTPLCREVFEGSPSRLHASVRVPNVFLSSCDLGVLLQMAVTRVPHGCLPLCPLARVTYPFAAQHQLFTPSVTPDHLSSSDVLFNKNLYNGMTNVFLLGSGLKGTGLQAPVPRTEAWWQRDLFI